ncbi:MAG: WbqC family protein [Saprospiraceae bacterium]|nr:WbqC family protein [Saprospiraceae bacterium]
MPKNRRNTEGVNRKISSRCCRREHQFCFRFYRDRKNRAFSSHIYDNTHLKSVDRVLDMCQKERATTYINAIGGQELYDKNHFKTHDIDLFFLKTHFTPYLQGKNEFIAGLSIIDVMMFNAPENIREMLKNYQLI